LFGLHLKILDTLRESKQCIHILKPVNQSSNSTLIKQATGIGKQILVDFNEKVPKLYNSEDVPVLESICYSVKKHTYNIDYGDKDIVKKKQKNESIVRALNEENILRNFYQSLYAIESYLSQEGVISKECQNIDKEMAQLISISTVDINIENQADQFEDIDIDDESIIQEVVNAVSKSGYRNIKDIL